MPTRLTFDASALATSHWSKFNTGDNRVCFVLTGIFNTGLTNPQDSRSGHVNSVSYELLFLFTLPGLAAGQGLRLENWSPFFTIQNGYHSSVGDFDLDGDEASPRHLAQLSFWANVNLSPNGALAQVGYHITTVGTVGPVGA